MAGAGNAWDHIGLLLIQPQAVNPFNVDFSSGFQGTLHGGNTKPTPLNVRCVSGRPSICTQLTAFTDNGDGTITDHRTGLFNMAEV
jgi:hypothetical protein